MTPTILRDRAKKMSEEVGLKCQVYGGGQNQRTKNGRFLEASPKAADEPPALIVMTYEPAGAPAKPVVGLVGKGVTFDNWPAFPSNRPTAWRR